MKPLLLILSLYSALFFGGTDLPSSSGWLWSRSWSFCNGVFASNFTDELHSQSTPPLLHKTTYTDLSIFNLMEEENKGKDGIIKPFHPPINIREGDKKPLSLIVSSDHNNPGRKSQYNGPMDDGICLQEKEICSVPSRGINYLQTPFTFWSFQKQSNIKKDENIGGETELNNSHITSNNEHDDQYLESSETGTDGTYQDRPMMDPKDLNRCFGSQQQFGSSRKKSSFTYDNHCKENLNGCQTGEAENKCDDTIVYSDLDECTAYSNMDSRDNDMPTLDCRNLTGIVDEPFVNTQSAIMSRNLIGHKGEIFQNTIEYCIDNSIPFVSKCHNGWREDFREHEGTVNGSETLFDEDSNTIIYNDDYPCKLLTATNLAYDIDDHDEQLQEYILSSIYNSHEDTLPDDEHQPKSSIFDAELVSPRNQEDASMTEGDDDEKATQGGRNSNNELVLTESYNGDAGIDAANVQKIRAVPKDVNRAKSKSSEANARHHSQLIIPLSLLSIPKVGASVASYVKSPDIIKENHDEKSGYKGKNDLPLKMSKHRKREVSNRSKSGEQSLDEEGLFDLTENTIDSKNTSTPIKDAVGSAEIARDSKASIDPKIGANVKVIPNDPFRENMRKLAKEMATRKPRHNRTDPLEKINMEIDLAINLDAQNNTPDAGSVDWDALLNDPKVTEKGLSNTVEDDYLTPNEVPGLENQIRRLIYNPSGKGNYLRPEERNFLGKAQHDLEKFYDSSPYGPHRHPQNCVCRRHLIPPADMQIPNLSKNLPLYGGAAGDRNGTSIHADPVRPGILDVAKENTGSMKNIMGREAFKHPPMQWNYNLPQQIISPPKNSPQTDRVSGGALNFKHRPIPEQLGVVIAYGMLGVVVLAIFGVARLLTNMRLRSAMSSNVKVIIRRDSIQALPI